MEMAESCDIETPETERVEVKGLEIMLRESDGKGT